MNKRGGFLAIIGSIILVVLVSGCIGSSNIAKSNNDTKNFTFNNVSFSYPANWDVSVSNDDTGPIIVVSEDYYTQIQIMITPTYGMSEEGVLKEKNLTIYPGWKKLLSDTLILNNQTAYRTLFRSNDIIYLFKDMRHEEIVFVKNNNTITILTTAPSENYNNKKQSFETILDSIHVQ
ncbi:MAG: hypothetical protein KO318_10155 [Methanobacterium sp.]|uniref:PsbP C-terminal domain-containing protein n=1 Tax=Methanobacterium subterraneum TaxID=59277 RepID=A0A2H4VAU3_9EURY|nr:MULTISPECIES: hypothetical protein [Methanobacterium]AUB55213.1 hypothetical protein BK007_03740 [Methanobacterium subterraneum]AUB60926.1 hypothetical protein BK009_09720 [Methanobacterium subterraneum]MBW4256379.1 hypothetical protein [Methanobacterium sp. YSL]MCC7560768.1 hypothetical protein [Methanobacterium sp.]